MPRERTLQSANVLVFSAICALSFFSTSCNRPKEAKVDAMFAGPHTVCARLVTGEVRCDGAMTNETTERFKENAFEPEPLLNGAVAIAFGEADGCALAPTGQVLCFGFHFGGSPSAPKEFFRDSDLLASGGEFFCARNRLTKKGECAAPEALKNDARWPFSRAHLDKATALGAGGGSACFIGEDKIAHCFFATEGITLEDVVKVATWGNRACGIRENGDVQCAFKTDVLGGKSKGVVAHNAKDLTLDAKGMCTLQVTNTVFCEENGTLEPLQGVFSVTNFSAAGKNRCFVNADHVAFCWGDNTQKEFGTKDPIARDVPTAIFFRQTPK